MLVRDIMTPNPITIRPDSDSLAAIAIMRSGRFKRLPVVDADQQVVGIVSFVDLVALHPEDVASKQAIAFTQDGVLVRVKDVMSHPVIHVTGDYPLEEAAQLMVDHHIGCLPVLEQDQLVGIVTDTDVFRTLVRMLGGGGEALRLSVQVDNLPGQFAELTGHVAEAGGNILSIASHPAPTSDRMNLTLRIEGLDAEAALDAVQQHPGVTVSHIWTPDE